MDERELPQIEIDGFRERLAALDRSVIASLRYVELEAHVGIHGFTRVPGVGPFADFSPQAELHARVRELFPEAIGAADALLADPESAAALEAFDGLVGSALVTAWDRVVRSGVTGATKAVYKRVIERLMEELGVCSKHS